MAPPYNGHFGFSKQHVELYAPDQTGVYYVGFQDSSQHLIPVYIGRAVGIFTSIRSRLFDHVRERYWRDATHFGFRLCASAQEAEILEQQEIALYQPKYNTMGKAFGF